MIVGAGFDAADPCLMRALFWESPTDPSPDILATESPQDQARAEAISNPDEFGRVQVVGWNESQIVALLWEQDGQGNWNVAIDLNNVIGPCSANWTLIQAHDISDDDGWIVGWGLHDGEIRAFLLAPIDTCLWDLDGDGDVGPADLAYLLTNWGPCTEGLSCFADFDCSGEVGPEDLAALLTNWGPCPPSGGGDGQGGDGGSDEDAGWPELDQLVQWLIEAGQDDLAALLQEIWQDMDTP